MLRLNNYSIHHICKYLDDREKVTILRTCRFLRSYLPQMIYTDSISISKICQHPNYDNFANVIFDVPYVYDVPRNIQHGIYRYNNIYFEHYPSSVIYVNKGNENEERKSVSIAIPAKKTRCGQINQIRHITYIGKLSMFDEQITATLNAAVKFYVVHDDLRRFQKIYSKNVYFNSYYDYDYILLFAQLMTPMPQKIFSYILNRQEIKAFAPQFVIYLMCMIDFGMPRDVRKIIVGIHAQIFWDGIYDKLSKF
uniref:F-box domain-containing protein n=1 Tax=viral metagenome TaxID=1070528 RepID=A0A6C0CBW3_9ZZZZ